MLQDMQQDDDDDDEGWIDDDDYKGWSNDDDDGVEDRNYIEVSRTY
jgi:hypothetical protein